MIYLEIVAIAGFACLYSAAAGRLERSPINGALVFVAYGLLIGPYGLGILGGDDTASAIRVIAELSLGLVLFVEASKADLPILLKSTAIPRRLILVALPLVILLGFGAGGMFFGELGLVGVAILATINAPTDAALGKAVVTNKRVPAHIREGLNFESGLNDGVCVPIFLAFMVLATQIAQTDSFTLLTLGLVVKEIGIGAIAGIAITAIAATVIRYCHKWGWVSESWMQLPVAATAIACFAGAQAMHGSGFIAAFIGGLLFGILAGKSTHRLVNSAEATGDTFTMITWIAFGASVVGQVAGLITWKVLLYAILSLTLVRTIPVLVAMRGLSLSLREKLFIGWFGPRGLATVVFALMVYQANLPYGELIVVTAVCTVMLSVILHGLSALPIIALMFKSAENNEDAAKH